VAPGNNYADWESCSEAADAAMVANQRIHVFTWWENPGGRCSHSDATLYIPSVVLHT
jgi:hypothetical protein